MKIKFNIFSGVLLGLMYTVFVVTVLGLMGVFK